MQEMWVRSLGREDHLEKEMVTHSSILAWETSQSGLGGHGVIKTDNSAHTHIEFKSSIECVCYRISALVRHCGVGLARGSGHSLSGCFF